MVQNNLTLRRKRQTLNPGPFRVKLSETVSLARNHRLPDPEIQECTLYKRGFKVQVD